MEEFLFFVLIIFSAVWGSVFLGLVAKRHLDRIESGSAPPEVDELREDVARLSGRLERVEEELTFYRELRGPEEPSPLARLEGPSDPES